MKNLVKILSMLLCYSSMAFQEEILFENISSGITLSGTLEFPSITNNSTPAIILIPGSGRVARDEGEPFKLLSQRFSELGRAVLRFDKRGCRTIRWRFFESNN